MTDVDDPEAAVDRESVCGTKAIIEILDKRNKLMHTDESVSHGRSFVPRSSDVFISTYPKCGTTWVSAIAHALRTRGDPKFQEFEEISEVIPWDVLALDCGQDLDADQVAQPRMFKSHEPWEHIPKGAKYIYVMRDPVDALVSFHYFLPTFHYCEMEIETFVGAIFAGLSHSNDIWHHFADYIQASMKYPDQILLMTFEDLKRDTSAEIKRVAAFLDVPTDQELLDKVLHLSSSQYMRAHENQFDEHFVFDHIKDRLGIKGPNRASKVRKGKVGLGRSELSEEILQTLRDRWASTIEAKLGSKTYPEMVEKYVRQNHRHHQSRT